MSEQTSVSADYGLFAAIDPTCEDLPNLAVARQGAGADAVGWAPNAVMVEVISDLARIALTVEVHDGPAARDGTAELVSEGTLELPGGRLSVPHSTEPRFRLGIELPPGPGTYAARIEGHGRAQAGRLWQEAMRAGPDAVAGVRVALEGVERYRLTCWQLSDTPSWPDDEGDD
ncbi:hypothetical protein ACFO1B_48690 [Dactylosporangium siamense]|uniref:Uncharacterized protein n=1 Tax=Dactylosporangium siamense TaxID=685454 RepID=A0A919PXG1_9ACTN|nr:hypothetical protein [Dactylosporangium siamense]GIG52186.1 hypothetical protein Dsi01nite_102270 [Dactylosporangium siamense]